MRDWKKAFGQPDDGFTLRVQQTLLAIEEKEEEPVKKKMTLSLAFACILFVTALALSAYAASNILGGRPDETLSPGENSLSDPTPAPTVTPMPSLTPMVPSETIWFGGTIAEPSFLELTLGTPMDETLAALDEKGYARAEAMTAESLGVTRCKWPGANWNGEPCEVRAYFAEAQTLGLGLVFERETSDEALPDLIKSVHACLAAVYGEGTPLAIPEVWPSFALKDLSLAQWSYLNGPRVFLVYQVRRDGLVQVEARIGYADAAMLEPDLMPMVTFEPTPILMALPTPMPMEPMPYWTTPYGNYYHLDEFCSGMEDAMRVSFETAMNMGKQPCPVCVVEYFRGLEMDTAPEAEQTASATLPPEPLPDDAPPFGPDSDGIPLMTDFNQPLRTGEARGWGIDLTDPNRDDFSANREPLNGEYNGVWTNDILTVHNMIFLKTRSAIFMEIEYSMNDNAISPWSIRITPFMEGEAGPLGWHDARVHEVSGEDNTIHYLLSVVTDSPVDFPNITNLWGVYGGAAAEEQRLLGSLGNNPDWGRQYGK